MQLANLRASCLAGPNPKSTPPPNARSLTLLNSKFSKNVRNFFSSTSLDPYREEWPPGRSARWPPIRKPARTGQVADPDCRDLRLYGLRLPVFFRVQLL